MTILINPLPSLQDNYIWLLIDAVNSTAIIIDPGTAIGCEKFFEQHNIRPVAMLITHRHWDHVDGIEQLKQKFDIPVFGPATEFIPCLTTPLNSNDSVNIPELNLDFQIIDIGGHTAGHIGYLLDDKLFCGDTLFSAGCGRLFDGTAEQLHESLQRIKQLPEKTVIYCAHEYTLDNLRFAQAVDPDNQAIQSRIEEVKALRASNLPSLPFTLKDELRYNPFLRTEKESIMQAVAEYSGVQINNSEDCFRYLRLWKDGF
ncbi:MAG: hydroxyacylglutathione hydrolase [Candidatus Scalindua sp.]